MDLQNIHAQMESDLAWRQDEVRFLHNQLFNIKDEDNKRRFRKSLIVMLYSHYEGFCRFALSVYAEAINGERLVCRDVTDAVVAASLVDVFSAFNNLSRKDQFFNRDLPDDASLHRFARQINLIKELDNVWSRVAVIPRDKIVNTESNLKPVVLKKILFQLGLPVDLIAQYEGSIHRLLNFRNNIAHGSPVSGIEEGDFDTIFADITRIMSDLIRELMRYLTSQSYRREGVNA